VNAREDSFPGEVSDHFCFLRSDWPEPKTPNATIHDSVELSLSLAGMIHFFFFRFIIHRVHEAETFVGWVRIF